MHRAPGGMRGRAGERDDKLWSRRMRAASFALCVVRYKNKIKSITWQTTPHLCGNLLFLDCVCSRRTSRTSESTFTLQSKVYHFPIWRPLFEGPRRTGTSRTLSQFPTVVPAPLPLPSFPMPAPVELQFMKICVAGAASSVWRIAIAT